MSITNDFIYTARAKRSVLDFLQTAFSSDNLFSNTSNPYKYSHDEKISRILIADYNTENLNSLEMKPALLIFRGQIMAQRLGIGDKIEEKFLQPYEKREILINVSINVNCYSKEGLESEFLAVTVFKLFRFLNEDIQKKYNIFNIEVQGIGSEQIVKRESRSDFIMTPVGLQLAIPDQVQINFEEIQMNYLTVNSNNNNLIKLES